MTPVHALTIWARVQLLRLAEIVRLMTRPERLLSGYLAVMLVTMPSLGLLTERDAVWSAFAVALVAATLLAPVLADAIMQRQDMKRMGAAMITLNRAKPTGAPRVAEVTCRHGDHHRFVFGQNGWELAGPAVARRPDHEEVPSP